MQLHISAHVHVPSPAPVKMFGSPGVNRVVGEFRIRFLDLDDGVTFTSHETLVAGARVGAHQGYATLTTAMADLAAATAGAASAAAVLERDGRFYGHLLKGRDHEAGSASPLRPLNLESDDRAEVVEIRTDHVGRAPELRALVDGTWSHRFRR
ncbi:MAG: hypothetical protein JWN41_99 [Thermoleophilia bacterium]|nr:hypothetical protein [Thermoleophilia bacterium]